MLRRSKGDGTVANRTVTLPAIDPGIRVRATAGSDIAFPARFG
ncbi:hypothetical protein [Mesorhizobium sp. A556]